MGSPISFSGFNKVDFNLILNTIMDQERAPLRTLQLQKTSLELQKSAFADLAAKLGALQTAAEDLSDTTTFGGRSVTNTDSTAVTVSPGSTTPLGTYDIKVNELARAQVTATTSNHTDSDTTIVATGGTLTIGGIAVSISGNTTLQGLADAINATADIGVNATIVSPTSGTFQLVLTGKNTGAANAFTITNALTGGTGITFADTDTDGISGDSAADNAVSATDAVVVVNNITVTSATNTIDSAIPGATVTALKKDPAATITVTVGQDTASTKSRVEEFVKTFNDVIDYVDSQSTDLDGIGRDSMVRSLRTTLREKITGSYAVGGAFKYLSEAGVGFDTAGRLEFDSVAFDEAAETGLADLEKLFLGGGGIDGIFVAVNDAIELYTQSGGLVPAAQDRIDLQVDSLENRIVALEDRLAIRRAALQKEFIAADQLMTRLNNQTGSLGLLGSQYRLF